MNSNFTPEQIAEYPELLNKPLTIEELISVWAKNHEEMVRRVEAGETKGLSFVDIIRPSQMLFHLKYLWEVQQISTNEKQS